MAPVLAMTAVAGKEIEQASKSYHIYRRKSCSPLACNLELRPVMGRIENRRHDRHEIEEPAFMRILGPPSGAFVITILDISKQGLRIRCSRELPHGISVEVRCRRSMITGEVRYSRPMEPGNIHLGIQVTSVSGKSTDFDLTEIFPDLVQP